MTAVAAPSAAPTRVTLTRRTYPYVPDAALVDYRTARAAWDEWRRAHGYAPGRPLLSEPGDNAKMAKDGRVIFGISLAPARESGRNVCAASTPECRALCLATAGSGRYANTQLARIMKTRFLWADPVSFVSLAVGELDRALHRWADVPRVGFRPNVLSDLPWETIAPSLVAPRPRLRTYDYTKLWAREGTDRYRLTYSRSERTSDDAIVAAVESGRNVAVAFSTSPRQALPRTYLGCRVIDGDRSDYRPADPSGVIVGLRAKGRARQARYRTGGFVVDVRNLP